MLFEIWVDADSVQKGLRTIILKASTRLGLPCTFVADRSLADVVRYIADDTFSLRQKAREEGLSDPDMIKAIKSKIRMVVVESASDSADDYVVQNAPKRSLCITHDIPLAARLLEKGCYVIDDRGSEYTSDDIRARLGDRLVNKELRSWGVFTDQQGRMDASNQKSFADNFDRMLTRLSRMQEEE